MTGVLFEDPEVLLPGGLGAAKQGEHPRPVEAGLEVVPGLGQAGFGLLEGLQVRKMGRPHGQRFLRKNPCSCSRHSGSSSPPWKSILWFRLASRR